MNSRNIPNAIDAQEVEINRRRAILMDRVGDAGTAIMHGNWQIASNNLALASDALVALDDLVQERLAQVAR